MCSLACCLVFSSRVGFCRSQLGRPSLQMPGRQKHQQPCSLMLDYVACRVDGLNVKSDASPGSGKCFFCPATVCFSAWPLDEASERVAKKHAAQKALKARTSLVRSAWGVQVQKQELEREAKHLQELLEAFAFPCKAGPFSLSSRFRMSVKRSRNFIPCSLAPSFFHPPSRQGCLSVATKFHVKCGIVALPSFTSRQTKSACYKQGGAKPAEPEKLTHGICVG